MKQPQTPASPEITCAEWRKAVEEFSGATRALPEGYHTIMQLSKMLGIPERSLRRIISNMAEKGILDMRSVMVCDCNGTAHKSTCYRLKT